MEKQKPDPKPKARLELHFKDQAVLAHLEDPIEQDLSAAAGCEGCLFLSCDEAAGVERLTGAGDHWANHRHFSFADLLELPGGRTGEMDIEGLDCNDGWLWVVGSHALKRNKPKASDRSSEAKLKRMEAIGRDANSYFLGRFPLAGGDDGLVPVAEDGERKAAHLKLSATRSRLIDWLRGDPHLGPFLAIPSKENGLDIEGIAARDMRVWLGLRGPVLRGWAVVLEMEMRLTAAGNLKAKRIDGQRRYRKHLLPTRGLGVRDLALDGDDLMLLVGPTMTSGGPAHVLRWKGATEIHHSGVSPPGAVEDVLELPYHGAVDHPEGLVRWGENWLVVYDSPSEHRLDGEGAVVAADIWAVPGSSPRLV